MTSSCARMVERSALAGSEPFYSMTCEGQGHVLCLPGDGDEMYSYIHPDSLEQTTQEVYDNDNDNDNDNDIVCHIHVSLKLRICITAVNILLMQY